MIDRFFDWFDQLIDKLFSWFDKVTSHLTDVLQSGAGIGIAMFFVIGGIFFVYFIEQKK